MKRIGCLFMLNGPATIVANAQVSYGGSPIDDLVNLFWGYTLGSVLLGVAIGSLLFGIVGAIIGSHRHRNGFAYGFFLWIIGIILLIALPPKGEKCPHCGGIVEKGYKVCKNCGRAIDATQQNPTPVAKAAMQLHGSIPEDHFQSILENCEDAEVRSALVASYYESNGFYVLKSAVNDSSMAILSKYFSEIEY